MPIRPMNTDLTLLFIAKEQYGLSSPFSYSGPLTLNTEAEWNGVTWGTNIDLDSNPITKFSWSYIVAQTDAAYKWNHDQHIYSESTGYLAAEDIVFNDIPAIQADVSAMQTVVEAMPSPEEIEEISTGLSGKQDHSENLDFWTDVAPNEHIEEMMSHASKSELHDYLEVGTAAFEDSEVFAAASHTHTASQITDFATATDARITTKIDALLNGAGSAYDTLKELQDLIVADQTTASALAVTVGNKVDKVTGKGLSTEDYTTAEKSKLSGIATGATANSSDAALLSRTNHTGTQTASTISNFAATVLATVITGLSTATNAAIAATDTVLEALGKLQAQITANITAIALRPIVYLGTTQKNNPKIIVKSVTVSGGNAVFYLTHDNTSTGNALFTNVYLDSVQPQAIESQSPHAFDTPSLSNGGKTLTIPVTKIAPVLGILTLNQSANGSTVKCTIMGD